MSERTKRVQQLGNQLVELFDLVVLFIIGATIIWAVGLELYAIVNQGYAKLKDILLLFIYLELGAMVGIYFKTSRLPVQFLIYIAITALSRHLVIDVQHVTDDFHLYLLMTITICVLLLAIAAMVLTFTGKRYGRPEDHYSKPEDKKSPAG